MIDSKVNRVENSYAKALDLISVDDIPPAVGEALKRYSLTPELKDIIKNKLSSPKAAASKAFKTK